MSIDQQFKTLKSRLQTFIKGYEKPLFRKTSSTNTITTRPVPVRASSAGGVIEIPYPPFFEGGVGDVRR